MTDIIQQLAVTLRGLPVGDQIRLRRAVVSAVNNLGTSTPSVDVVVGSTTIPGVPFLGSYIPGSGDTVSLVDAAGQYLVLGRSGVPDHAAGATSLTTNGSGIATITHNLGKVPSAAVFTPRLASIWVDITRTTTAMTATQVEIKGWSSTTAVYVGNLTVEWVVFE